MNHWFQLVFSDPDSKQKPWLVYQTSLFILLCGLKLIFDFWPHSWKRSSVILYSVPLNCLLIWKLGMEKEIRTLHTWRQLGQIHKPPRASQMAKVGRNIAPQGLFARFFKDIFRSDLLFVIGGHLGVPHLRSKFLL